MVAEAAPSSAIWSRRRDEITFDRLHKFWSVLSPRQRNELLRLDKQTLIEHARKNLYCSRCNGLLLESFAQIVVYGKSLHQEGLDEPRIREVEAEEVQDPSVHPWGGLSTTKDGILTVLDCFINAKSLHILQNVFDNARAREREREMLYPDACGGSGRGWISPVVPNYGRGHGTRDTCALHTARLSCDTLVDFWSALGEETRSSLLRMKEEDFIERLMHRFDSKRFCRDCRRNVIREFKELKELKRMRKEPHCTNWFCVADTAFMCEVFEDTVLVDWHQSFLEQDGPYHHFEWAIGTDEGKTDILDFENVGLKWKVHRKGIDLDQYEDYFVTLRAWGLDGRCTEFCVKAHALKGQSCVHRRLVVGDGFVTITKGESIRSFFEHAEEAEEEDEDDAMDRDGNDPDSDAVHPQKHAKSPELAREFLLDAAAVIFKEQVEKAFREGTARQNAHSVFVSLALKLLEERVHVACKEIITLEKQTKLLEEEEKEKREEEERRERRRTKEREKKHRRKERLKGKDKDNEKTVVQSKASDDIPSPSLSMPATTDNQSQDIVDSRYSSSEDEDKGVVMENYCPDTCVDQSSSREIDGQNNEYQSDTAPEFVPTDCNDSFLCEESKSSRRNLRYRRDFTQEQDSSYWHEDCQDHCGNIGDIQHQSRERIRNGTRGYNSVFSANNRTRDRYNPCSCGHQEDYRYFSTTARPSRETKMLRKSVVEKPRLQYRRCYPLDSFTVPKGGRVGGTPNKNGGLRQVWEPMDPRKKASLGNANNASEAVSDADRSKQPECSKDINACQKIETGCESISEVCSKRSEESCKADTDQPCEGEKNQAGPHVVDKPDCCLTKDAGQPANLTSSDSSSCLSEGDRDSSMSSMTSLSAQNAESSTSDSEESTERNNSSPGDPPTKNGSRSLLEMCAGNGFREFKPKSIQPPDSNQIGFSVVPPFQDQLLRHQKVQAPPYSSTFMSFQSHPLSVPTNGYVSYPQPGHFYPSPLAPVGYGVPGSQCVEFPVHYGNNIHRFSGSEFGYLPQQVHKAPVVSFHAVTPAPLCTNAPAVVMNPERQQNHVVPPSSIAVTQNGCSEDNTVQKDDGGTPFSLFQFNLPIAPPAPTASKGEKCGGAMASGQTIAQGQPCPKEEADIKEYNLFSGGCTGLIFPFN